MPCWVAYPAITLSMACSLSHLSGKTRPLAKVTSIEAGIRQMNNLVYLIYIFSRLSLCKCLMLFLGQTIRVIPHGERDEKKLAQR
jgi:hypothetical protein